MDEIEELRAENHALKSNLDRKCKAFSELFDRYMAKEELCNKLRHQIEAAADKKETGFSSTTIEIDPALMMLFDILKKEVIEKNETIERQKHELQAISFTPTR